MRTQYCRQHIKKTAEECDLGDDIVTEVERVDKFCASNPAFADCGTRPVYRLISEKDMDVRNKAISFAENALNDETPTGGKIRKRLTEPEMIVFIRRARREVRGEPVDEPKKAKKEPEPVKQDPDKCFSPQPGSVTVTNDPPIQSLAAQVRQSEMQEAAKNQQAAQDLNDKEEIEAEIRKQVTEAVKGAGAELVGDIKIEHISAPITMEQSCRAPCLDNQPCPTGGMKLLPPKNSTMGIRCTVNNQSIKQLFKDECPILAAAWKKEHPPTTEGFHTERLNGAKVLHELGPVKIVKPMSSREEVAIHTQQFIDDLPKQSQEDVKALLKVDKNQEFGGDSRELIIILLADKAEQIGRG